MAHMIDQSAGRDAIAFVGQTPWHRLGRALTPGADLGTWAVEAGLEHTVERAEVQCASPGGTIAFPSKHVLYRSDTRAPLSVVSKGYQVVQPAEILGFFADLIKRNSFELETAGALDGGRRIWALARVNDGECLLDADMIRPYVLLATSYDATMCTTAKFTSVRVVCHNTLTMAAGHGTQGATEVDQAGGVVKVGHYTKFNAADVRLDLGIVFDQWERFLVTIDEFSAMGANWDGYGAAAIGEMACANARAALSSLLAVAPCPDLSPNPNGTISMEWESESGYAVLEIGNSRFSFYLKVGTRKLPSVAGNANEISPALGLQISQLLYAKPQSNGDRLASVISLPSYVRTAY